MAMKSVDPKSVRGALDLTRAHHYKYPKQHSGERATGFQWEAYLPAAFRRKGEDEALVIRILRVSETPSRYRIENPKAQRDNRSLTYVEAYELLKPFEWPGVNPDRGIIEEPASKRSGSLLKRVMGVFTEYMDTKIIARAMQDNADTPNQTLRFEKYPYSYEAVPIDRVTWDCYLIEEVVKGYPKPLHCFVGTARYALSEADGKACVQTFLPDKRPGQVEQTVRDGIASLAGIFIAQREFGPMMREDGAMSEESLVLSEIVDLPYTLVPELCDHAGTLRAKMSSEVGTYNSTEAKISDDVTKLWRFSKAASAKNAERVTVPRRLAQRFVDYMLMDIERIKRLPETYYDNYTAGRAPTDKNTRKQESAAAALKGCLI